MQVHKAKERYEKKYIYIYVSIKEIYMYVRVCMCVYKSSKELGIIYPCLTLFIAGGLNRLNRDLVDADNL